MSDRNDVFLDGNGKFVTSGMKMSEPQNFACRLPLPLLLPVPNFIVIGVSFLAS